MMSRNLCWPESIKKERSNFYNGDDGPVVGGGRSRGKYAVFIPLVNSWEDIRFPIIRVQIFCLSVSVCDGDVSHNLSKYNTILNTFSHRLRFSSSLRCELKDLLKQHCKHYDWGLYIKSSFVPDQFYLHEPQHSCTESQIPKPSIKSVCCTSTFALVVYVAQPHSQNVFTNQHRVEHG